MGTTSSALSHPDPGTSPQCGAPSHSLPAPQDGPSLTNRAFALQLWTELCQEKKLCLDVYWKVARELRDAAHRDGSTEYRKALADVLQYRAAQLGRIVDQMRVLHRAGERKHLGADCTPSRPPTPAQTYKAGTCNVHMQRPCRAEVHG